MEYLGPPTNSIESIFLATSKHRSRTLLFISKIKSSDTRSYSRFENSEIITPTLLLSIILSQSPIPGVVTTGRPAARYSAILVGEDERFEYKGRMKDRPASAADATRGIS
ncbi:MAG: hypothetical protein EB127_32090 [Alphaproteobacteria bacterium]|nr:hypothetical protein [Alphaproteobacteria bacterium]